MQKYTFLISVLLLLFFFDTFPQTIPTDGLIAYYPFNGNSNDESGNDNHLTNFGAILTKDRFGNENSAYYFNGTDAYLKKLNGVDLTSDFTICVWINVDQYPKWSQVVAIGDENDNVRISSGYPVSFWGFHPGFNGYLDGSTGISQTPAKPTTGRWHHIVGVRQGSTWKVFWNNRLETSTTGSSKVLEDVNLTVSKNPGSLSEDYFKGSIDDILIYNRALNESEIDEIYNEGWEINNRNLIVNFPFNGNALDESGNELHGEVHGATLTTDRYGNPNSAYLFDGIDDYILTNSFINWEKLGLNQNMTISAWLLPYSVGQGNTQYWPGWALNNRDGDQLGSWWTFGFGAYHNNNQKGSFGIHYSPQWYNYSGTTTLEFGNWYHMVVVLENGNNIKIYINGQIENNSSTNDVLNAVWGKLAIGRNGQANGLNREYLWDGKIDDIVIFGSALTDNEVYELFLNGVNQPPIANAGEDQLVECSGVEGTEITLDGSGSSDPDGDELKYTWSIADSVIASGVNPSVSFAPGEYVVTLTVDDGNGETDTDEVTIKVDADLVAPEIILVGDNPLNLYRFSEPYVELGAEVTDDCDPEPALTITGSVDITLPGSYYITYEASDFNGNTSQVIRVVNVLDDPAYLANQYLFLSEKKVKLDKLGQAVGNIHSNDKVDIKKGPTTYLSNVTALDKIDIKKDITIEGDVRAGGELKLDENVIITGISEEYATVDYVDIIQFDFTSEGEDIKVEKNEMYDITPNSYGKVEVKDGATLNFSTGEYFTKELKVMKDAKLVFDITNGPIKINVEKKIDMDKEVEMSLLPLGVDDSRYVVINSMKDIKVDEESLIFGSLNAPYGKVDIKKDVEFYGSISAEEIDIDKEVTSIYHADNNEEILAKSNEKLSNDIELEEEVKLPTSYILAQNYPNPFNPTTTIQFSIPEANYVSLRIYDLLGKEIAVLVDETKSAGSYTYEFDGSNLSSGVYVYRLQAGKFVSTKKLVLMK